MNSTLLGNAVPPVWASYYSRVKNLAMEKNTAIDMRLDSTILPANLGHHLIDRDFNFVPTRVLIRLAPVDKGRLLELVAAHELGHTWLWLDDFPLVGSPLPPDRRPEWFAHLEPLVNSVVAHPEIDRRMRSAGYELDELLDRTASDTLRDLPTVKTGAWRIGSAAVVANVLMYADFILRDAQNAAIAAGEYQRISAEAAELGEAIAREGKKADLASPEGAQRFMGYVVRAAKLFNVMMPLRESVLQ